MNATLVPSPAASHRLHGSWLILGSIAAAQIGAGVAHGLFSEMAPTTVVFWRQLLTGLVLLAIARPNLRSLQRTQVTSMLAFGAVMSVMNLTFYEAVARLPLAMAVTIELAGPISLSLLLSRRRIDAVLACIAAAGVLLIRSQNLSTTSASSAGIAFALAAGACWATYILLNRQLGQRFDRLDGLALGMSTAALFTLPVAAAHDLGSAFHGDRPFRLLVVALLSGLIVFSFEYAALRRMAARTMSLLLTLSPVAAAFVGLVWLNQRLSMLQIAGIAVIVAVNVAVVRGEARRKTSVGVAGLEPETSTVSRWRSNQLSYTPEAERS